MKASVYGSHFGLQLNKNSSNYLLMTELVIFIVQFTC